MEIRQEAVKRHALGMSRHLDLAISALLAAFILVGPLLVSPWGYDHALLIKESFLILLAGTAVILLCLRGWAEPDFSLRETPLVTPIALLLGSAVLSLSQAVNLPAALHRLAILVGGIFLYLVATHARMGQEGVERFAAAAVASGVIASLYAFLQQLGLDPFLPEYTLSPTSTLGNPNFLADYLILVLPLSLGLCLSSEGTRRRRLYLFSTLILFSGLLLSRTKAASLGLLFALALFTTLLRRQRISYPRWGIRRLLPVAAVAILLVGLFGFAYFTRFAGPGGIRGTFERYASFQATYFKWRLVFYQDALKLALDNPLFGVGIGNFQYAYPKYRSMSETLDPQANVLEHAFNDYLELWAELGPAGLIAFLWLLWAFFRRMFQPHGASVLACAYAASIGGLAIDSLFAFVLHTPIPFAGLWLCMAFALRPHDRAPGETIHRVGTVSNRRPPTWAVLLLLPAMAGLLYASLRPLVADAYLSRGDKLFKGGQAHQSLAYLERAAGLAPARFVAQGKLAQASVYAGRYADAVAALDRYLKYDPLSYHAHHLKGLYLEQAGDEQAALAAYEKARQAYPLYSKPLLRIGMIRERQGDTQGAMAAYREGIRLNPAFAEASNNLAILFAGQGKLDEAIRVWEEGAKRAPEDPIIARNLAGVYRKKGEPEKAVLWEERAQRVGQGRAN